MSSSDPGAPSTVSTSVLPTTASGSQSPSCVDAGPQAGESQPAGDPIVLVVGASNAWEVSTRWTRPVDLAVYDGGAAVRPVTPGDAGATVPAMELGLIDTCGLRAALSELTDLAEADFGEPGISDQGTTTVTFRPAQATEPRQISVYALDADPGSLGDLNDAQVADRERLAAALDALQSAVAAPQPWSPDRVRMIDLGGEVGATSLTWPGPGTIGSDLQRSEPACVVLDGDRATAVLTALGGGGSTATWADQERSVSFTTTVLVPGQAGCPE